MPILNHSIKPGGLHIQCDSGWLILTPYTPRIIRIRYNVQSSSTEKESLLVTAQPEPDIAFSVEETDDHLILKTVAITISIDRKSSAFTYYDHNGFLLTKEPDQGGKQLEPVDVYISDFGDTTTLNIRQNADGVRVDTDNVRQVFDRRAFHTKLAFEWADGEALYGLGSHEEGMFNLRGQHQYLYQQNMKAVVPVLVSTRGYGVFVDSCSLMMFHDDAEGSYLWSDIEDELDYYFVYGPEFDQIVQALRLLTGQAPMLPKWTFGYIQSKERYKTQDELIDVVREYRERELPLDCIVLDWQSWTGDLWGQKTFDPERFPDPRQMSRELHQLNAHLMISIWPTLRPGGANWQELSDNGHLLGNQATYNAFDPDARACYWRQASEGLFAMGVDAWWTDSTEPFEADWQGAEQLAPAARMRLNTEEAKRYLDPGLINAYSLFHSQGIYQGQRQATSAKRVVNLTRSAMLGQQRYSTITWSGDVSASWETLRKQIADGVSFGMTGMPYWTTDIGAFFVHNRPDLWFWSGEFDDGVDDLGYRELYVRWFQFGAFLPIFRSHGTDTPREIWRFGEPGDLTYNSLRKFLDLRYRLLPYIYSLAGWTTHDAYTMLRALPFDFRDDPQTFSQGGQYMFGPAFLVSPVFRPMYYESGSQPIRDACRTWPVYLPAGSRWIDFWTGDYFAGGQTIVADARLDTMPLFVRAGSIIPMGPRRQYAADQPDAPLELHIYGGENGQFVLYEDEGDSYNYERGEFSTISISWENHTRLLTLGRQVGDFPGLPKSRSFHVYLHEQVPHEVANVMTRQIQYDGREMVVDLS